MSFTEALQQAKKDFSKGPACTVAAVLADHPEADAINAAFADRLIPGTLIAKALVKAGHQVRPEAVQRHRRHACGCERP